MKFPKQLQAARRKQWKTNEELEAEKARREHLKAQIERVGFYLRNFFLSGPNDRLPIWSHKFTAKRVINVCNLCRIEMGEPDRDEHMLAHWRAVRPQIEQAMSLTVLGLDPWEATEQIFGFRPLSSEATAFFRQQVDVTKPFGGATQKPGKRWA